jgi:hypothetical protein
MSVSWLPIVASCCVSMPMGVCQPTPKADRCQSRAKRPASKAPSQQSLGKRRAGPTLIWVVPLRELRAKRPPAVKSRGAGSFPPEFEHCGFDA